MSDKKSKIYKTEKDIRAIEIYDVYVSLADKTFDPNYEPTHLGAKLYQDMYKAFIRFYFKTKKRVMAPSKNEKGETTIKPINRYEFFKEPENDIDTDAAYRRITTGLINSVDDILTPLRNLIANRKKIPRNTKTLYTLDKLKDTIKNKPNFYAEKSINFNFFKKINEKNVTRKDVSLKFAQIDYSKSGKADGQYNELFITFEHILKMFDFDLLFYVSPQKELFLTVQWTGDGNFTEEKLADAFYYFLQEMTGANASFFANVFFPHKLQESIDKIYGYKRNYLSFIDGRQGNALRRITPAALMTTPVVSPTTVVIDDPVPTHDDAGCDKEISEELIEVKKEADENEALIEDNDGFDDNDPEDYEVIQELTDEQKELLNNLVNDQLVNQPSFITDLRRRLGRALHAFLVAEGAIVLVSVNQNVKGGPSLSTVERLVTTALIFQQFFAPLPEDDNPLKINSDENIPDENIPDNDIPGGDPPDDNIPDNDIPDNDIPDDVPQGPADDFFPQIQDDFGEMRVAVYSNWTDLINVLATKITELLANVYYSGDHDVAAGNIRMGIDRIFQDYAWQFDAVGISITTASLLYAAAQTLGWDIYSSGRYQSTELKSYIRNDVTGSRVYFKSSGGGGSGGGGGDDDDDDGFYFEDDGEADPDKKGDPYKKISPDDLLKHLAKDDLVNDILKNAKLDVSSNIGALKNVDLGLSKISSTIGSDNIAKILNQQAIIEYARLIYKDGYRGADLVYQVVYNLALIMQKAMMLAYSIPYGLGTPILLLLISIIAEPVAFIIYYANIIPYEIYDGIHTFRVTTQKLVLNVFSFVFYISKIAVGIVGFVAANPLFAFLGVVTVAVAFAYYNERKSIKQKIKI